ncbi:hypothetical protein [Nitrosomonas sp.]|uniref:hypothetical protein n=1 Tax=Nitrosomonas sp. TaxID=42353 RepID=UPI00248D6542|nr:MULTISPECIES: hypothetical protein [Nitrosomonas]MCW5600426.1 hypothetical protein [Nitrosomonas sp.]
MSEKLQEQRSSSNPNRLSETWINAIFEEFHGRFGNAFFAKFQLGALDANGNDQGIENAKTVWAKRLADYSPEEISRGVNTEYDYPPDLDSFKKACRPSLDYEAAFYEANEQMKLRSDGKDRWSNPAIYHAAAKIGQDMNNPYAYIKRWWKYELDNAIYDVSVGNLPRDVPKRPVLVEHKRSNAKSTVALAEIAKINEILNTKSK